MARAQSEEERAHFDEMLSRQGWHEAAHAAAYALVDGLQWFHHPDFTVDVSVIPFLVPHSAGYENTYIQQKFIMTED